MIPERQPSVRQNRTPESVQRDWVYKPGSSTHNYPKKAEANQELKKPGRKSPTLPSRSFFPLRLKPTATRSRSCAARRHSSGGFEDRENDDHERSTTEATNRTHRNTRRRDTDYCYLINCGGEPEFIVDHPDHGRIDVCGKHAENIVEIGGEVVELA